MGKRKKKKRTQAVVTPPLEVQRPTAKSRGIIFARTLVVLSLAIAGYLAWGSLKGGSLPGCGPSSGCDKVLQSRWAYWLGLPVTVPALVAYACLLWATLGVGPSAPAAKQRMGWAVIISVSVVVTGAALWFVGLQVFVLKSFCPFCLTAHISAVVASVILLWNLPVQATPAPFQQAAEPRRLTREVAMRYAMAGVAAWVVLLAGQFLVEKPRYAVKTVPGMAQTVTNSFEAGRRQNRAETKDSSESQTIGDVSAAEGNATVTVRSPVTLVSTSGAAPPSVAKIETNGATANGATMSGREIILHQGKHRLLVDELPIIGSAKATNLIVSLFDYTCHYCREMHGLLLEAQRRFSNQLAIVSLPMPLDADCNRLMRSTPSAHVNACQYAKFGLAVWRSRPEVFDQFDFWIFSAAAPPPLSEVRQHAEQLVGHDRLEQALASDWVKNQIQADIGIYESNSRELKDGRMPQLVIGSAISVGPLERIDQLYTMLAEQLGLKPGP